MSNGWNVGRGLAGTGIVLPIIDTGSGFRTASSDGHATAFFISTVGIFVTAKHVMDDRDANDLLAVVTIWADGVRFNVVTDLSSEEGSDIAVGTCHLEPQPRLKPWTLSTLPLTPGSAVSVFGFPHNETQHRGLDAEAEFKLRLRPDYHDGEVLDFHPTGVSLVREPAYATSVVPRPDFKDLGGVSGGPMLCLETGKVHGMLSTCSEGYSVDGDHRNRSIAITETLMAITENGSSRSVVRPIRP